MVVKNESESDNVLTKQENDWLAKYDIWTPTVIDKSEYV